MSIKTDSNKEDTSRTSKTLDFYILSENEEEYPDYMHNIRFTCVTTLHIHVKCFFK